MPAITAIRFVHTCNDVIMVPAAADCLVQGMGVVTISFVNGWQRQVFVGLGQAPVVLPSASPAPS
jgi:hypothetical protein